MSKPELKRFIELTKAKSSEVNNNFDLLNNYVESVSVSSLTSYDPTTTYPKGAWIIGGIDNKKTIYESLVDDNKGNALDDERYWKKITLGGGMPVGTIFPHSASATFVPENSLACDGTEYTQNQFPTLYTDWLANGNLETCTYTEYQQEITTTGECLKFGIDTAQGKFKVPTKLNKYVSPNQTKLGVVGNGMTLGLENGTLHGGIAGRSNDGIIIGYQEFYNTPNGTLLKTGTRINDQSGHQSLGVTTDPTKSGLETTELKTKEIRYFVVVATGSIKQSEMDWSAWASGLQGKANVDLGNTTSKLADSFIDKLLPDYSAGIAISKQQLLNGFKAPSNGVLMCPWGIEESITIDGNDVPHGYVYTPQKECYAQTMLFMLGKNQTIKVGAIYFPSSVSQTSKFYPLKGAN